MSVSSIDSSRISILSQYYYQNLTANSTTENNNSSAGVASLKGVTASNADGDTFQMSGLTAPAQLSASAMYSTMDSDGDGSVSESEFVALRPSDVTEEMANTLYMSFDTDSSGSLTETEFATAMNQALSVNAVSATATGSSTAAASSAGGGGGGGGGGTAAAGNSCPVGNSTCTSCGQCGKITLNSASSGSTQNNANTQATMPVDYLSTVAIKAYETNSIYL